jgi:hypothetical protein
MEEDNTLRLLEHLKILCMFLLLVARNYYFLFDNLNYVVLLLESFNVMSSYPIIIIDVNLIIVLH